MNHQKVNINRKTAQVLEKILIKIEEQLTWGAGVEWTGSDFEKLSDLINHKTGQSLSVSTLKRIWGRTSQDVQPSVTTLNILAEFTGAESWRAFDLPEADKANVSTRKRKNDRFWKMTWSISGAFIIIGILLFSTYRFTLSNSTSPSKTINPESVEFSIEKVTKGLPNTVVFRYDLGRNLVDTLELQQTWDESRRIVLNPEDSLVTSTYLSPGYFNAKLVADNKIIKSHNLYLPSEGLGALVSTSTLDRQAIAKEYWNIGVSGFNFNQAFFEKYPLEEIKSLMIVNLLPEPIISSLAFSANIHFQVTETEGANPCHPLSVLVTGSQDVHMFSLGLTGCAGNFGIYLGGLNVSGKTSDLSALGFELNKVQNLKIRKEGSKIWASLGGKELLLSTDVPDIGKIGGIRLISQQDIQISEMSMSDKVIQVDLLY